MENNNLISAGEVIKKLRENTGLSVFKVAKAVHISGNYLSEIERGTKEPSDIVLDNLAEFYKVPSAELFALYNRVAPAEAIFISSNSSFRRLLTEITVDKNLTDKDREHLFKELGKLYNSYKEEPK